MSLLEGFLDLLFPPRCAFCRRLMPRRGKLVCPQCEKDLPYASGSDIKQKMPFVSCAAAPLYYEGKVRESLLRYKFGGCPGYADAYAPLTATSASIQTKLSLRAGTTGPFPSPQQGRSLEGEADFSLPLGRSRQTFGSLSTHRLDHDSRVERSPS